MHHQQEQLRSYANRQNWEGAVYAIAEWHDRGRWYLATRYWLAAIVSEQPWKRPEDGQGVAFEQETACFESMATVSTRANDTTSSMLCHNPTESQVTDNILVEGHR